MASRVLRLSVAGRMGLGMLALSFGCYAVVRGMQESYAVFLLPVVTDFGWSRGEVSSVYSFAFVTVAVAGPFVGALCDRWGPLRVTLAGVLSAAGAAGLASQATALWQFYATIGVMMGVAVTCVGSVPITALLSRWYRRRLTTALAVAHSASGAGILVFGPLAQLLIDGTGWRLAYAILAGGLALFAAVFLTFRWRTALDGHPELEPMPRRAPRRLPSGPDRPGPTLAAAIGTAAFWGMATTYFSTSVGMFLIVLQVPAFLVEAGYTPHQAAGAFGALGLMLPVGMIGFGWLGDRIGRARAVLISYALTASGVLCLLLLREAPSMMLLALFVALFGGTFGCRSPALSTIAMLVFRGPDFGRIFGTIMIGMGLGGGLGAWLGGMFYDLTGGYVLGLWTSVVFLLIGAAPFVLVPTLARR